MRSKDERRWFGKDDCEWMLSVVQPKGAVSRELEERLKLFAKSADALGFCRLPADSGRYRNALHMVRCVGDQPNRRHQPAVAAMLRDLAGNPWGDRKVKNGKRPAWITPQVIDLAQAARDAADPVSHEVCKVRMAVLADAMEEAGCSEYPVSHLRDPLNKHYSFCYVLNMILGKDGSEP